MNTLTLPTLQETAVYDMAAIDQFAREHLWRFRVWLPRGVITEPMTYQGFVIAPVEKVPPKAEIRFNCLTRRGVHYKQILVAHEIPEPKPIVQPNQPTGDLGVIVPLIAVATLGLGLLFLRALMTLDPAVIIVLDPDDTWLEILNWRE